MKKIKKLYCILIPELTSKYNLFIYYIIGSLFRKMIPSLLSDYIFKIEKNNIEYNEELRETYFDVSCNVFSDLLTFIPHCISSCYINGKKTKAKRKSASEKKDLKINFIFNEEEENKCLTFKIIFIISVIDFICQMLSFGNCILRNIKYFNATGDDSSILRNPDFLYSFLVIDIVSRYIFSSLILKTHFYVHHHLSFFLNFIGLSILLYTDITFKIQEYNNIYKITIIAQYILYSLEDIINKVALNKLFITPESLLFYKGLFSFVYLSILTACLYLLELIQFPIFDKTFIANIMCRLYFIVFNIIRSIYLVKVIDFFSSEHISFLRVLETIVLFFFYKIDGNQKEYIYKNYSKTNIIDNYFHLPIQYELIEIGAFFILLFSTLIHNEIIILNCKKLKRHTIYFLNIEADKEKADFHVGEEGNTTINDSSFDNTKTLSSLNDVNITNSNTNSF